MEREVGGGIGMGNTCKPMADSFQCMTKSTTTKKKERSHLRNMQQQGKQQVLMQKLQQVIQKNLAKIMNEGGYIKQKICNEDERAFYWREMSSQTFL